MGVRRKKQLCEYVQFLICFGALILLSPAKSVAVHENEPHYAVENRAIYGIGPITGIIGAIADASTRTGREEIVAMEIAIEDLNKRRGEKLILHVKRSHGDPVMAAQTAKFLVKRIHVLAIIGLNSWEESQAVAKVGDQFEIPIVSFSEFAPPWATSLWQFFVQASPSVGKQMAAVAAMVRSWRWSWITVVYEDVLSATDDILNNLYGALLEANVRISNLVSFPVFASSEMLSEKLETMKKSQCRVFVVHVSSALAARMFEMAEEKKMMEKGYIWLTTDLITSLVHSMNPSDIASMQGVVGVRKYFSEKTKDYLGFYARFNEVYRKKYPKEKNHDPGISALLAYDTTWALGSTISSGGSNNGTKIIEKIQETNFLGLSGRIQFRGRKLAPKTLFQIINVIGKSYREVGFWRDGLGFSTTIDINTAAWSLSMESLGHFIWPGDPRTTPRGWELPTISNPMRIGVPNGSLTKKFVRVDYDSSTNKTTFSGFSIDVFMKSVGHLKYSLPCQFIAFDGNYTDLVKQVQLKEIDAAVGDIAITSSRYQYVDFTHAHTESGVVMVVPIESHSSQTWLFMKPFTKTMWLLTTFINVYNGFVIWSIERNYSSDLRGKPALHQIGTLIWLAFATLFSLHGEKLHSNLSRMATVVWLFVALIVTQSYTASLTSMLTIKHLEPKITNIETLLTENAIVGCSKRSFVRSYLESALHFNSEHIKNFTTIEAYAESLRTGDIAAAFLESPVAKLFVARYCKSFVIAGPTYKVGGYGFAFPKGSPLVPDMDEALLNVFETGALNELENGLLASEKCIEVQTNNEPVSLSPQSFFVLFILTGATSTTVLVTSYVRRKPPTDLVIEQKQIWIYMSMFNLFEKLRNHRRILSRKVSDIEESSKDFPN